MNTIKVLIIGPMNGYGGVASVINSMLNHGFSNKFFVHSLNTFIRRDKGIINILLNTGTIVKNFIRVLVKQEIRIVHIHTSAGLSFIRKSALSFLALFFSKKVILHIHASRFYDYYINQHNPLVRLYIRLVLRVVDCVVVLCHDWKRKINGLYGVRNLKVLRNPVELRGNTKLAKEKKDKVNLLFMGEFEERKGLIDLLETTIVLKKDGFKFTLFLCGKGKLCSYVDKFVKEKNLSENIVNCGWVSGDKKEFLFKNTDIFILPSYKEGVPIAILEAYSYGIPVISTKISGIPELVKDNRNGILISPGDKNSLCIGISKLIENPELRQQLKRNNLIDVKKYSIKNVSLQWEELYDSLV